MSRVHRYYKLYKFYEKYGFWGISILVLSVISVIAGVWVTIVFVNKMKLFYNLASSETGINPTATSMVGDFIGGVIGTIWSFAGVLLFFLALRLQSKEISLQVKELKETREVFTVQQFENTFFNLLKTQQEIKSNIEYEETRISLTTRQEPVVVKYNSFMFFDFVKAKMKDYYKDFREHYRRILEFDSIVAKEDKHHNWVENSYKFFKEFEIEQPRKISDPLYLSKSVYKIVFNKYHNQIGHYFRNLYHILSFLKENEDRDLFESGYDELIGEISNAKIDGQSMNTKRIRRRYKKYAEFVQAQMSASELFVLFYNGLFFSKMKALVHHYKFLENLSIDDLLNPLSEGGFYNECVIDGKKMQSVTLKSRKQLLSLD